MHFAIPQEVIFLQDTFGLTLDPQQAQQYKFMLNTYNEQIRNKQNLLLSKLDYIVDSALFEYLQQPNLNPLIFLVQAKIKINDCAAKPWFADKEVQDLVKICNNLVDNYSQSALTSPDDLFPERLLSQREEEIKNYPQFQLIARLFDIFDTIGFDEAQFDSYIKQLSVVCQNVEEQIITYALYCVKQLHIFAMDKLTIYFKILNFVLYYQQYKIKFFTSKQLPWIPHDAGGLLTNGCEPCSGINLEQNSWLGPFLHISLLQEIEYVQSRADSEFKGRMTIKQFETKLRNYQKIRYDYTQLLTELIKGCLKKGQQLDYFAEMIRYLKTAILANKDKIKEGLHLDKRNRILLKVSSDGFMLNLYDVLLELSRKIFDRADQSTYLKIDPAFFKTVPFPKDQPLISRQSISQEIEIGNVSNLFFYTLKYAQYGLIPAIVSYKELLKEQEEMNENLELFKQMGGNENLLKQKLKTIDARAHQYESVLFDSQRIKDTFQLYDTMLILLFKWLNLPQMVDGQCKLKFEPNDYHYYIPEFLITDFFEVHVFYIQFKEDYIKNFMNQERGILMLNLTTYLLNLRIADNKYLVGQLIELIFLMIRIDKKKAIIQQCFAQSEIAQNNFLFGLLQYYSVVGETGESHQFYSKFSYRFYINDIFIEILKQDRYCEQLRKYQKTPQIERFLRMVIDDINYSIEEAWAKLGNLCEFEEKLSKPNVPLKEKLTLQKEQKFYSNQCRSNLSHSMSTLKVLCQISQTIPELIALHEIFRESVVANLNNYLCLIFDKQNPKLMKQLKNVAEKEFKISTFSIQLAKIYINLSKFKEVMVKAVCADKRSFKLDNFSQLLNVYTQSAVANTSQIDEFINFIQELQAYSAEEFEIEDLIEIPEKYQDPLFPTLMRDPVKLPCNTIIDRKTIKAQLLTNPKNPFTNQPLTESQLIEMPQLKIEIEQWLKSQKDIIEKKKKELFKERALQQFKKNQNKQMIEEEQEDENGLFQGKKYQSEEDDM